MKKGFLLIAIALFGLETANAQRTPDLGFGLQIGNPEGAYESLYGGTPVGLGFNASFPLSKWAYNPIELGVDFGTMSMGTTSADRPYLDDYGNQLTHNMDIRSSTNVGHAQVRFKPFTGRVKPYADALIGFKSHKTVLDNAIDDGFGEFGQDRDVLLRDFTSSYGYAIGLQLKMGRYTNLDLKVQKLWGGATQFVDQNSVVINSNGGYDYDVNSTPSSNLFVAQVGITFDLGVGRGRSRTTSSSGRHRANSRTGQ
jgi:hypothetical protein